MLHAGHVTLGDGIQNVGYEKIALRRTIWRKAGRSFTPDAFAPPNLGGSPLLIEKGGQPVACHDLVSRGWAAGQYIAAQAPGRAA